MTHYDIIFSKYMSNTVLCKCGVWSKFVRGQWEEGWKPRLHDFYADFVFTV